MAHYQLLVNLKFSLNEKYTLGEIFDTSSKECPDSIKEEIESSPSIFKNLDVEEKKMAPKPSGKTAPSQKKRKTSVKSKSVEKGENKLILRKY